MWEPWEKNKISSVAVYGLGIASMSSLEAFTQFNIILMKLFEHQTRKRKHKIVLT